MSRKSIKREVIEWIAMIAVIAILYMTGYHTEVIGFLQRMVLATGIIQPDTETTNPSDANYDFQLVNAAGRTIEFDEFKNKTVFMNFWATWCPPCVAEMPDIHDLYENVGQDVVFVMISVDEDREKALRFVQNKEYDFPIYFLHSRLPEPYKANTIPTTYILSPEGKIVAIREGMAKYNTESFKDFLLKL